MREIPVKNYIILSVIAVGVVILCLFLRVMYKNSDQEVYTSIVKEVATEIKYDDLENYLQENLDTVIYINDSSAKANKDLEKDFKKLVTENSISSYVVYIERNDDIVKKYDLNSSTPILIAYQNGVITEILSKSDCTIDEIESFLIRNKVIEK